MPCKCGDERCLCPVCHGQEECYCDDGPQDDLAEADANMAFDTPIGDDYGSGFEDEQ